MLKERDPYNQLSDFRDVVLDMILEKKDALEEFYLALHGEGGKEKIERFRKNYTGRVSPLYYFTVIARGEFYTHFVSHGDRDDITTGDLYSYAEENYRGFVNEFYDGDERKAPVFRYAVIMMDHKT